LPRLILIININNLKRIVLPNMLNYNKQPQWQHKLGMNAVLIFFSLLIGSITFKIGNGSINFTTVQNPDYKFYKYCPIDAEVA
jgi:hypothetical protein